MDFALLVGCGIVKYNPGRLKGASPAGRVLSPRTVLNSRTSGFGFGQLLKWSQSKPSSWPRAAASPEPEDKPAAGLDGGQRHESSRRAGEARPHPMRRHPGLPSADPPPCWPARLHHDAVFQLALQASPPWKPWRARGQHPRGGAPAAGPARVSCNWVAGIRGKKLQRISGNWAAGIESKKPGSLKGAGRMLLPRTLLNSVAPPSERAGGGCC